MRNTINIKNKDNTFTYLLEYVKEDSYPNKINTVNWCKCDLIEKCIHLFEDEVKYFRHNNDWYSTKTISMNNSYIPENTKLSKIKVYIPNHCVSTYVSGVKYMLSANTWINGYKLDLGSFVFKPTDTIAIESGPIFKGNFEYNEYIEFDIVDPFHITYSDDWHEFRKNACNEPDSVNDTGSILNVSLFVVDDVSSIYENRYTISSEYIGSSTGFDISNDSDHFNISLTETHPNPGLNISFKMNSEYDWLLSYLYETYNIDTNYRSMYYEIVIKNKNVVIPCLKYLLEPYNPSIVKTNGSVDKYFSLDYLMKNPGINEFFSDWNNYEAGWSFASSFIILDDNNEEIFSIVSNELPITQEIFSRFYKNETEKIIDLSDMNINKYNIVNKIKNEIIQLERPNESKNNIVQHVFYKVNDSELITLHPLVNENICINLNDYLSATKYFVLQVEGCRFEQIGVNSYGVIFKIGANVLPLKTTSGTYYILDENMELITTGKYNCVL